MTTQYTAKGRQTAIEFVFKYDLKGNLLEFKVTGEPLTEEQKKWLFGTYRFPCDEEKLKVWIKNPLFRKKFKVEKLPPNLSFDALWELYGNKVKKVVAEKAFKKLKEPDIIKCFIHIPKYKARIARTKEAQAHLATYLNQRYFEDEE